MKINDKSNQFIAIIEANKGILYKIVNIYSKTPDDKNDLIQEIIVKLWQAFENYQDEFKYSTWMYRIALNTAISSYRKEKTRKKNFATHIESIFEISDTDDTVEKEEKYVLLQQFISELKELDKAIMLLYFEEKNHLEISEILGISKTNVGTRISRIKNLLKEKFSTVNN